MSDHAPLWDRERDDRGVSELIGYLLLFATVISGTLVLSTMGLGMVFDSGGDQHQQVAETNLARFDDGVDELLDDAPYRTVRLEPVDAAMSYGDSFTVRLTASGGGVDLTGSDAIEKTGTVVRYDLAESGTLSYVGGLLAYSQPDGVRPLVRTEPDFRTSGSRMVFQIPLTVQAPRSSSLVAGETGGGFPVALDRGTPTLAKRVATRANGSMTTMQGTVTVSGSQIVGAWGSYFEGREAFGPRDLDGDGTPEYRADTDGDGAIDTAGARFQTQRLYVRTVDVGVRLGEGV